MIDKIQHKPVLLKEVIDGLGIRSDGIYVDCTFGRGGHSKAILELLNENGKLFAIDRDIEAVESANKQFGNDSRFKCFHGVFSKVSEFIKQTGFYGKVDGILVDLGVSSPQIDVAERGFSFLNDGPLKMCMDANSSKDAAFYIANWTEDELETILREYGEERFARRITRAILNERNIQPITTTKRLADIVAKANPKWEKHKNPATRSFQAIRIAVNNEFGELRELLSQCSDVLAVGGRLAVISFHSLEDRIVKQFFVKYSKEQNSLPDRLFPEYVNKTGFKPTFRLLGKAIKPSEDEKFGNVRARSAVLRMAEKINKNMF